MATQHSYHIFDSDTDNEEEEAAITIHNTIATQSISQRPIQQRNYEETQPATYLTQPTQRLSSPLIRSPSPAIVQVEASSPARPTPQYKRPLPRSALQSGGRLASMMAPPGTAFRSPYSQQLSQQQDSQRQNDTQQTLGDMTDDEDVKIDTSDTENGQPSRADITPSTFIRTPFSAAMAKIEESPDRPSDFKSFASRFAFDASKPSKRSADAMADAYGSSRRPNKVAKPTTQANSKPMRLEMTLEQIPDFDMRGVVKRILSIYPSRTVSECYQILKKHKGNEFDAMDALGERIEAETRSLEGKINSVDLTESVDGKSDVAPNAQAIASPLQPQMKRKVQTSKTITDKYSSTQNARVPRPLQERDLELDDLTQVQSPPKPRKRLMQRKRTVSPPPGSSPVLQREVTIINSDSDSDNDHKSTEAPEEKSESYDRLLQTVNTCSPQDLMDLSMAPLEHVELVIKNRPYTTLDEVRTIYIENFTLTKTGKQRKTQKRIGDKIVETCLEMWAGYEAVDTLVEKCEKLGRPIAEEMKSWGFDAFGAAQGELQMTDLRDPSHDSGIGTPISSTTSINGDDESVSKLGAKKTKFIRQPAMMSSELVMKDYQVAGINWLSLLFHKNLSCILADEMGLGKTCQVIAFLAHLTEIGVKGPHLVVVPGSTLENWLRELGKFCPTLRVEPYYGGQNERAEMRYQIEDNLKRIDVIVTTYDMATGGPADRKFLQRINWKCCVYDEGHMLRNGNSNRYKYLMKIPADFRLLLTGTPLQNNLQELVSLLAFIMPRIFEHHAEDLMYIFKYRAKTSDSDHTALLSAERIARARSMMTPFILRRKKYQVLKHLPKKTNRVEYCDLSESQQEIYTAEVAKVQAVLAEREAAALIPKSKATDKSGTTAATAASKTKINNLMDLRKAAIHPLLFRHHYTDALVRRMSTAALKEPTFAESSLDLVIEDMSVMTDFELSRFCTTYPRHLSSFALPSTSVLASGKVSTLLSLLTSHRASGSRTLVFSQFTMVLDILEPVLTEASIPYCRLDGSTRIEERQDLIDEFTRDTSIEVFMLSTKAGGTGVNLACANKVVIFDMSFNPQDDVQAENRAHRVTQTREVEVVRLVSRGTIEEQMLRLGESKLALDDRVAGEGGGASSGAGAGAGAPATAEAESKGAEMVERMMRETLARPAADKETIPDGKEQTAAVKEVKEHEERSSDAGPPTRVERKGGLPHRAQGEGADIKDEYMKGLKAAGLEVEA